MIPERAIFLGVLGGSVIFHVALVIVLPSARVTRIAPPALVVDMIDAPPLPPPREDDKPAPAAPSTTPRAAATQTARTTTVPIATSLATEEAPADFTGIVLAGAPAGASTASSTAGPPTATTTTTATIAVAAPPRRVPAASLAKPPRAPGLDAALERHYPIEARRAGIAGRATLRVEILPDGRIGSVSRLSETYPGFGDACTATVRSARWEPPIDRDGAPVATEITYTCRFEVRS